VALTLNTPQLSANIHQARCLHDNDGELDPEKSRKFLEDYKDRSDGKRNNAELAEIKAAAQRCVILSQSTEEVEDEALSGREGTSEDELVNDFAPQPAKAAAKSVSKHESPHANKSSLDKEQKKLSAFARPTKSSTRTRKDAKEAIAKLAAQGVVFESDSGSDSESDEANDPAPPTRKDRPRDPLWQGPKKSRNLFDVAPEYLPPTDDDETPWALVSPKRLPRKQQRRDFLARQCAERKAKFGNPHWEVDRLAPAHGEFPRMVKTLEERKMLPFNATTAAKTRNVFDVQVSETRMVEMPFDKFLGMPERPVACLIGQGQNTWGRGLASRDRGQGLGFRDGGKERERGGWGWGRGSGRVRVPDEEKWPVGCKG
jgi:hypothetical protein